MHLENFKALSAADAADPDGEEEAPQAARMRPTASNATAARVKVLMRFAGISPDSGSVVRIT
jgi:hypothetical protein